jgi:hypothetical protein
MSSIPQITVLPLSQPLCRWGVVPLSLPSYTSGSVPGQLCREDGGDAAGELLAGNLEVYVNNANGLFSADELARIQDAVNAADAVVEPYGVSVAETTETTLANVVIDTSSSSAVGGYADGILGCYSTDGEITLIQGWNWYVGANPSAIGATQYDFQTTVTHELGRALGLGESTTPASAMYGTLAPGTVIRTLTTADLAIPYDEGAGDPQRAAEFNPSATLSDHDLTQPGGSSTQPAAVSSVRGLVFAALEGDRFPGLSSIPIAGPSRSEVARGLAVGVRGEGLPRQIVISATAPASADANGASFSALGVEEGQESLDFPPIPDAGLGLWDLDFPPGLPSLTRWLASWAYFSAAAEVSPTSVIHSPCAATAALVSSRVSWCGSGVTCRGSIAGSSPSPAYSVSAAGPAGGGSPCPRPRRGPTGSGPPADRATRHH